MFEIKFDRYKAPYEAIPIGHQGENAARCLIWDISSYIDEFGAGTVKVKVTQPVSGDIYWASSVSTIDTSAIWTIDDTDTAKAGTGMVELYYYGPNDEVLAKSDVMKFWVLPTQGDSGEKPSPYEDLLEQISELVTRAETAAESAEGDATTAAADAETAAESAASAIISAASASSSAAVALAAATTNAIQESVPAAAVASFSDGADGLPVADLTGEINAVQSFNGYSNPWPGGGGANQWDEEWEQGGISLSDGTTTSSTNRIRSKNFNKCVAGQSYYLCCAVTGANQYYLAVCWYDQNEVFISGAYNANGVSTAPNNAAFFKITTNATPGSDYGGTYNHDIAINYPSSVTTYSPYANICPISGFTEMDVYRAGKNLAIFNPDILTEDRRQAGMTYHAISPSAFRVTGVATGSAYLTGGIVQGSDKLRYLPAGTYTLSTNVDRPTGQANRVYLVGWYVNDPAGTTARTFASPAYLNSPKTFTLDYDAWTNIQCELKVGYDATNGKDFWVQIEQGSTATDYAENETTIIPLVWQKNLIEDLIWTQGYFISATGAVTENSSFEYCDYYAVTPGDKFILSAIINSSGSYIRIHEYDSSKTWLRQLSAVPVTSITDATLANFTISEDAAFIRFSWAKSHTNASIYFDNDVLKAATVYGGSLDVTTGVLTVTWGIEDIGNIAWIYDSNNSVFYKSSFPMSNGFSLTSPVSTIKSTCYKPASNYGAASVNENEIGTGSSGGLSNKTLIIKDPAYSDPDAFRTARTGQKVIYKLETPVTYNLTPTEVTTLLGQNNIWTDCNGNTAVTYRADTKTYIDNAIAAIVNA